ncbi:MAG: TPM domain-containing protein [Candidatus Schekmanbacteria bacterium]|nr:TPM domain-containing protein [Candidatus Schekmanbacteria bacterium]
MRHIARSLGGLLVIVTASLVMGAEAQAGQYPRRAALHINDYAKLLAAPDNAQIQHWLTDLDQRQGIEAVVVTINAYKEYATGEESFEAFATNLFNRWGIGDATKNNGAMMLVSVRDRAVRIELGAAYGSGFSPEMDEVIQEHVIPHFKRSAFSKGIANGVQQMVKKLDTRPAARTVDAQPTPPAPEARPAAAEPPASPPSWGARTFGPAAAALRRVGHFYEAYVGDSPIIPALGGLGLLTGAVLGLRRYCRFRTRRCATCGTAMIRLDEAQDDRFLEAGQLREEALKSVDYDIWLCEYCGAHRLAAYKSWFSSFSGCPRCRYRTLETKSVTLIAPTYSSSGTGESISRCGHCDHHERRTYTIPRRTHSTSGSGSRSGYRSSGGRSSGGGASGRW